MYVYVYTCDFLSVNTYRFSIINEYREIGHATNIAIDMKRHSLSAVARQTIQYVSPTYPLEITEMHDYLKQAIVIICHGKIY